MLVQLFSLLFLQATFGELVKPVYVTYDIPNMRQLFEEYLQKYNKVYDDTEKELRFENFSANLKKINEFNKLYEHTVFDMNHLTDWTEEELKSLRGYKMLDETPEGICEVHVDPTTPVFPPVSLDWRDFGWVTPVKNQGECGSCWAFSAIGLVESRFLRRYGKPWGFSEQQLVDCSTQNGCNGSLTSLALTYLMSHGLEFDGNYPYLATEGDCRYDRRLAVAQVYSCTQYKLTREESLKELLYAKGPLSVAVAARDWPGYGGGVWEDCDDKDVDHAVLLVGYGSDEGQDYWIVKNSWGPTFGEGGYIRIKRGVNCNGIAGMALSAEVFERI